MNVSSAVGSFLKQLKGMSAGRFDASFVRLLSNSGWNLLGQGLGLAVAIVAIPILLKQLGADSFGLFTVFLALIGYSGLLDLGIGRAVTAVVAKHARLLVLGLLYVACSKRIGETRAQQPSWPQARELLGAGGWMTVSNVVSPIMTNLDRLFISAQISPAAAALHVTPYELGTKTLLLAGSIANATFPEFATHNGLDTRSGERKRYFWRAMLLTSAAALLPALILFAFPKEILTLWISHEFADGVSTDILRVLAIGIFANGVAYIPFAFVQGIGRSDVAAKFHLVELAVFSRLVRPQPALQGAKLEMRARGIHPGDEPGLGRLGAGAGAQC